MTWISDTAIEAGAEQMYEESQASLRWPVPWSEVNDQDYYRRIFRAGAAAALPHLEGATSQFDEPTYRRVHNFMRGWDQGEVISASIIDRERQATLTYTDLCALLDAYKREGAAPASDEALAAEVEPWLRECGSCDAGLPMACTCPRGDYRNILLKVWRAYEASEGATPAIDRDVLRAEERQRVAQSIREEAVDEAVDGFVQLTAVIRMCEEAGR